MTCKYPVLPKVVKKTPIWAVRNVVKSTKFSKNAYQKRSPKGAKSLLPDTAKLMVLL